MNNIAQHVQLTMKEMVGTRHHDHRHFQRLCPGQYVGEFHGCIFGTMDDDGIGRNFFGFIGACAFDKTGGGANQDQSLCRGTIRCELFSHAGGDKCAK